MSQSSICPQCGAMLDPLPEPIKNELWLKCRGCDYRCKENKRIVKPIGGTHGRPGSK